MQAQQEEEARLEKERIEQEQMEKLVAKVSSYSTVEKLFRRKILILFLNW